MSKYIALAFDSEAKATAGLHALWELDLRGDITVHGAAVIRRDEFGYVQLATKSTDPGLRTALGVGLGALLGALAGPVGAAAGIAGASTIAAGTAAGLGAAAGGAIGLTADAVKSGEHEEAAFETGFVLNRGESAVIAEISEDWEAPLNTAMRPLGGRIYRRSKDDVRYDSLFGPYDDYLFPYDCEPTFA